MRLLEFAAKGQRGIEWDGIRDTPMPGCRVHDLRDLPLSWVKDETYDGIYSEHFIEHITKEDGIALFKECMRILKPSGCLRTVWPSMDFVNKISGKTNLDGDPFIEHYYRFYIQKEHFHPEGFNADRKQDYVAAGLLHQKGEHKHLWYEDEMMSELKDAGFGRIRKITYQDSRLPQFCGIETPGSIREAHSSVVEAFKPWA
jgi:predicted SAM-dependent methyltransferase